MTTTKTRESIARDEYGIHPRTLDRIMARAGHKIPRGFLTPKTIAQIYEVMGCPILSD